eukprot:TRINITY_DN5751_c0_g1_i1.p1 TRINITY_DN5751_c0_g1~~TRINITY_DN5751_c0_g1_i1.p1  ORF type:complete len:129 (-),score=8.07 TRINITY_DN5751_c0_g1_i1:630-1016(-)
MIKTLAIISGLVFLSLTIVGFGLGIAGAVRFGPLRRIYETSISSNCTYISSEIANNTCTITALCEEGRACPPDSYVTFWALNALFNFTQGATSNVRIGNYFYGWFTDLDIVTSRLANLTSPKARQTNG